MLFPTRWYQYAKALECYLRASFLRNTFPLLLNNLGINELKLEEQTMGVLGTEDGRKVEVV